MFKTLYDAGSVRRYHTQRVIKEQDLAAHQWGVAMIIREIMPGNLHLLEAALTHDLAESITGDIPYTGKLKYPTLKGTSDEAERHFAAIHGTPLGLTHIEERCLAWADMFECFLYCLREIEMGNKSLEKVADTAWEVLNGMEPPSNEAKRLLKDYHG